MYVTFVMSLHTLQKMIDHWVVTLVPGDSGCEKFILVLEVNCVSNLSLNDTLQLTTLREWVTTTAFQTYDAFVMILSQMFSGYYICICICILHPVWYMHAGVTSFEDAWSVMVREASCLVVMQLAYKQYINHSLFSLSATMVTTLWLKQPICSCSGAVPSNRGSLSHP